MNGFERFDMVAVAEYTRYLQYRTPSLREEFKRVGIDKLVVFWQYPNPFDRLIMNQVVKMRQLENPGIFNCTMGHYRILKTAYELGMDNILVCEDDCRWLTSIDRLHDVLESIPDDADFCKFEWFFGRNQTPEQRDEIVNRPRVNRNWISAKGVLAVGAAACYYSRKAMAWKIDAMEAAAQGLAKLRVCDMYDRPSGMPPDIRAYLAMPLAAVQEPASEGTLNETVKDYSMLTQSGTTKGYGGK